MAMYQVRKIIKKKREYLNLTQENLSEEICSIQTLYRIENGRQGISHEKFTGLMNKLGLEPSRSHAIISGNIENIGEYYSRLEKALSIEDYTKMEQILIYLEEHIDDRKKSQQYVMSRRAILDYELERINNDKKLELLEQALELTVYNWKCIELSSYPLTIVEVDILCEIAKSYSYLKNITLSHHIFKIMLDNLAEDYIMGVERVKLEIKTLKYLSDSYCINNNSVQAIETARKALTLCREKQCGYYLAELLHIVANEKKSKIRQAYYIAQAFNQTKTVAHIENEYLNKFGDKLL
jgi:transcriptional regulator with XRE-family HTH domain